MSVFAFVERSIHSCPQCGLAMLTGITEDDDGCNPRLVHWCECCRVDYPDAVWRVDIAECHKAVARFKAMTSGEVDAVLAGRSSMAKQLTALRTGGIEIREVDPDEIEADIVAFMAASEPQRRAERLERGIVDSTFTESEAS